MAGVYVHIPFCKKRCKYCDFYSTTDLGRRVAYVDALLREIEDRRSEISQESVRTIYFGGGTPSQLAAEDIARLIEAIGAEQAQEITVEVNPGDTTLSYLKALRETGVNRLSIGIQSLHDERLRIIGRRHTAEEARSAVEMARRAGFENISVDLMYGLPGQTMGEWEEDIEGVIRMNPEHISAYCLQWEEGTVLMEQYKRGEVRMTDEEVEMQMFDRLMERLEEAGYEHYEVSNFARPGYQSQHNSGYWNGTPYVGIGAAAHSYDGMIRSSNPSDLERYIRGAEREKERLTDEDRYNEQVMLSLRTAQGLKRSVVSNQDAVDDFIRRGLLRENGDMVVATKQGLHILNSIIETLMI